MLSQQTTSPSRQPNSSSEIFRARVYTALSEFGRTPAAQEYPATAKLHSYLEHISYSQMKENEDLWGQVSAGMKWDEGNLARIYNRVQNLIRLMGEVAEFGDKAGDEALEQTKQFCAALYKAAD